jgi:hypothetical protein
MQAIFDVLKKCVSWYHQKPAKDFADLELGTAQSEEASTISGASKLWELLRRSWSTLKRAFYRCFSAEGEEEFLDLELGLAGNYEAFMMENTIQQSKVAEIQLPTNTSTVPTIIIPRRNFDLANFKISDDQYYHDPKNVVKLDTELFYLAQKLDREGVPLPWNIYTCFVAPRMTLISLKFFCKEILNALMFLESNLPDAAFDLQNVLVYSDLFDGSLLLSVKLTGISSRIPHKPIAYDLGVLIHEYFTSVPTDWPDIPDVTFGSTISDYDLNRCHGWGFNMQMPCRDVIYACLGLYRKRSAANILESDWFSDN